MQFSSYLFLTLVHLAGFVFHVQMQYIFEGKEGTKSFKAE